MEKIDFHPKAHLFICCRHRDEKGCCSAKGGEELVKDLKNWVKNEKLFFDIKVSKSSCLGYCETGVTACLYPQNQWFHKLKAQDLPELKEMLKSYAK